MMMCLSKSQDDHITMMCLSKSQDEHITMMCLSKSQDKHVFQTVLKGVVRVRAGRRFVQVDIAHFAS
jgi:hypothetical protein